MTTPSEHLTAEKLDAILAELRTTHPTATAATVVEWLDIKYDLGRGQDEHDAFVATANAGAIARWIAAGLDRER